MISFLFQPARLLALSRVMQPLCWGAALLLLGLGLDQALIASPIDYQQGDTVRIMYIHVPCATLGLLTYVACALCAIAGLVTKNPFAHALAQSAAPVGLVFSALCLITGSLWGQSSWGTWWVWDARLTSMLVLFLLYAGYLALVSALPDQQRRDFAGAVLLIIGLINVPIVKFSVDWWQTLHQPASLLRDGGAAIAPSMLLPLLLMMGGQAALAAALVLLRLDGEIARRKAQALQWQ